MKDHTTQVWEPTQTDFDVLNKLLLFGAYIEFHEILGKILDEVFCMDALHN